MTLLRTTIIAAILVPGVLALHARSETITLTPDDPDAATRISGAAAGDVVELASGEYTGGWVIPAGVTVQAAAESAPVIHSGERAMLRIGGANVTIRGIELRAQEGAHRGIDARWPVRVENCRFHDLPEAIALMAAPLSDVIHCSFDACGIGVRAIAGASPTVWGCRFTGGRIGVFAMEGGPYIRNNIFSGQQEAMRLVSGGPSTMIVQNNIIHSPQSTGVFIAASKDGGMAFASIRNNVFSGCSRDVPAATGPAKQLIGFSHNAISGCHEAPLAFTDDPPEATERQLVKFDRDAADVAALQTWLAEAPFRDQGRARDRDVDGGDHIGLTDATMTIGPTTVIDLEAVPVRFNDPMIANCGGEQYLYFRMKRLRPGNQALLSQDGHMIDQHTLTGADGKPFTVSFLVDRYFGESAY